MPSIQGVCFVDFSGNLDTTACGEPVTADSMTTVFLSGATCPRCKIRIGLKLEALRLQSGALLAEVAIRSRILASASA